MLFLVIVVFDTNEERNVHFHPPDLHITVQINLTLSDLSFFNSRGRLEMYQCFYKVVHNKHAGIYFALTKVIAVKVLAYIQD